MDSNIANRSGLSRQEFEGAYDWIFGVSSFKKLELDHFPAASIAAFFR
jgi:hypothetical protein